MRERSRLNIMADRCATITLLAALAIFAVFAGSMLSALGAPPGDTSGLAILYALFWFPTLFYLGALGAFFRAFRDVARDALFGPAIESGLRRGGWLLLIGGGLNLLVILMIQSATVPAGLANGDTYVFRGLKFDPAYLVLLATGLALLLLARLVKVAAAQRAEAQLLEAELEEFI